MAVYHRVALAHGSTLDEAQIGRRFREVFCRWLSAAGAETSESAERTFWRGVVAEVLPDVADLESCFRTLFDWFGEPAAWRCFPDVEPALAALERRGYRLVIASNYDSRLHAVCDGLPPVARIPGRVISSEAGWRKPHRRFYARLQEFCGCRPEEILMVGDDLENDVSGARRAGLRAVHVDRDGGAGDGAVSRLTELEDWLSSTGATIPNPGAVDYRQTGS